MEEKKSGLNEETFGTEIRQKESSNWEIETPSFVMPEDEGYRDSAYVMPQESYRESGYSLEGTDNRNRDVIETGSGQGRALEVCALIFGILGIVCCICFGFFGITGFILSIICFAKGKKSGLSVAALICSVFGIVLSIVIGLAIIGNGTYKQEITSILNGLDTVVVEAPDDVIDNSTDITGSADTPVELNANSEYADIIFCGKEIKLPCKFKDIQDVVEIEEYSRERFDRGIEGGETDCYSIALENSDNHFIIGLRNPTDKKLTDMSEAIVYSISESNYNETEDVKGNFEVLGGLKIGSSLEDVKKIASMDGDCYESHEEDYDYYSFSFQANEWDTYFCTVFVSKKTGKVYNLDYAFY